jgi:hypothetical protein
VKLVNYYVNKKYTLPYTGSMVLDVNQIIVNEKGIFINAISPMTKAKLRLLFEVAPLARVFQNLLKPHPAPIPLDPSSSSSSSSFLGDKFVHSESLFYLSII